jgi:hypothetical protein
MKKNRFIVLGMLMALLAIPLVLTGCDTPTDGGSNTETITLAGTSWRATLSGGGWEILSFSDSTWSASNSNGNSEGGTYTRSGNTVQLYHGSSTSYSSYGSGTISGNTLTIFGGTQYIKQ